MSETPHAETLEDLATRLFPVVKDGRVCFWETLSMSEIAALRAGAAALRQPRPGTCATCKHYSSDDPDDLHCADERDHRMAGCATVPTFGCIYHAPQTETP